MGVGKMTPEEILTADLGDLGRFIASRVPMPEVMVLTEPGLDSGAGVVFESDGIKATMSGDGDRKGAFVRAVVRIMRNAQARGMFSPEELAALIQRMGDRESDRERRRVAWGVWGRLYGEKPDFETLEGWEEAGGAEAVDGCWVEPDGVCEHGAPSWLLVLGLI